MTYLLSRLGKRIVGLAAVLGQVLSISAALPSHPVIGPSITSPLPIESGEALLAGLQCTACHRTEARSFGAQSAVGPRLGAAGLALTPQFLRAYLLSPQSEKPGTTMPDSLHSLKGPDKAAVVDDLVHYLISTQPRAAAGAAAEPFLLQQGRQLFHSVGCVACHAPQESPSQLQPKNSDAAKTIPDSLATTSVPLGPLAKKYEFGELQRFLVNPVHFRPSGRMPASNLSNSEGAALAMYLLREQALSLTDPTKADRVGGLSYAYYEGDFNSSADFDRLQPVARGVVNTISVSARKRDQNFGFRYSGKLHAPADGKYTFNLASDDGSQLSLDGKLVLDNDGVHAPENKKVSLQLKAGDHDFLLTFFNSGAGHELKLEWSGPNFERSSISSDVFSHQGASLKPLAPEVFTVDQAKVARGQSAFSNYGCVACHQSSGVALVGVSKALVDVDSTRGCLADKLDPLAPDFSLSDIQRADLRLTLKNKALLKSARSAAEEINFTLSSLSCTACHSRDGKGGPVADRLAYFMTAGEIDLGDEGRIPPHLTRVGGKLRTDWMREVLINHGADRPYMATRMPQFGESNVGKLPVQLSEVDGSFGTVRQIASDVHSIKSGRKLVGSGGLTCISCHNFADHKSLGVPAIDLTTMTKRLRKEWFQVYMLNPAALRPGTRMPSFWPEGKAANSEILDGNTEQQIDAIWAYLSKGREAEIPSGFVVGKMEIIAEKEPVIYRNFIKDAGSRAIGVGYPEKANLAFDANEIRLALIWQGSFIDASRHSNGRGEGYEPPLGDQVIKLPQGPTFAVLDNPSAPWPTASGKSGGFKMGGYRLDQARRPIFLYSFKGLQIEDHPVAQTKGLDSVFLRTFSLRADQPLANLWFRAAVGQKIEPRGDLWSVDDKITLRFPSTSGGKPVVRNSGNQQELLVPVHFEGVQAKFVEEIVW